AEHPKASFEFKVTPQYSNMRQYVDKHPQVVDRAKRAIAAEGLTPTEVPIRGGTDGSLLSARGLPTPNLFAGQYEIHSLKEWTSLQDMAAASATVVRLVNEWHTAD